MAKTFATLVLAALLPGCASVDAPRGHAVAQAGPGSPFRSHSDCIRAAAEVAQAERSKKLTYKIAKSEEKPGVWRRYSVVVSRPVSEGEVRALTSQIARSTPALNSVKAWYFLPDADPALNATPTAQGRWVRGQGVTEASGSRPIPVPKASACIAKDLRPQIYHDLAWFEDRGFDHAQAVQRTADEHRVSKAAVEEIAGEGFARGWPLPNMK